MLKRVITLDTFDLNYLYDEHLALLSLSPDVLPRAGILIRIFVFFLHLFDGLLHPSTPFFISHIPKGSILFFVYSTNQRDALLPVAKITPNSRMVGHHRVSVDARFPLFWAHLVAIPFFPLVLLKFLKAHGYRKSTFRYAFDEYWLSYGYYIVGLMWLKWLAPSALVVSNDHIMPCRVIVKVAKELNIPTVYIQHASVNLAHPSLCFDYALLDGKDALQKYSQIGQSQTIVFLVGIAKLDAHLKDTNDSLGVQTIGICTNHFDPMQRVEILCEHICNSFPDLSLHIRPHPGDKRFLAWQALANRYQVGFSDSRVQLSFDFLRNIDAVIVGESNILLEAVLMNVFPLYYDFGQQARDDYDFVQNGLTQYALQPEQIIGQLRALLQSRPKVQIRAQNYCATIGTKYYGRSSELAADLIRCIASREQIDLDIWSRLLSSNLEAYELSD